MKTRASQAGFTYLALLFFVATIGAVLAITGMIWSTAQQRAKERNLLFVGNEFRKAIGAFYEHTPGTVKRYPLTLEDLLLDQRQLGTVRYLRRVYPDPLAPDSRWGLVRTPDGGIKGVYSLVDTTPLKSSHFKLRDTSFEGALHYSGWSFTYETPTEKSMNSELQIPNH